MYHEFSLPGQQEDQNADLDDINTQTDEIPEPDIGMQIQQPRKVFMRIAAFFQSPQGLESEIQLRVDEMDKAGPPPRASSTPRLT